MFFFYLPQKDCTMEDIHQTIEMKKELYCKTEFQVEDAKYNWIKQDTKEEDNVVLNNKSDIIKKETFNPEVIKQDPEHYFGCLDVKPVLLKQELTEAGNEDSDDKQRLSLWISHPTDAVSCSTKHNSSKDKHTLTSTDLLAMEMKSSGL